MLISVKRNIWFILLNQIIHEFCSFYMTVLLFHGWNLCTLCQKSIKNLALANDRRYKVEEQTHFCIPLVPLPKLEVIIPWLIICTKQLSSDLWSHEKISMPKYSPRNVEHVRQGNDPHTKITLPLASCEMIRITCFGHKRLALCRQRSIMAMFSIYEEQFFFHQLSM